MARDARNPAADKDHARVRYLIKIRIFDIKHVNRVFSWNAYDAVPHNALMTGKAVARNLFNPGRIPKMRDAYHACHPLRAVMTDDAQIPHIFPEHAGPGNAVMARRADHFTLRIKRQFLGHGAGPRKVVGRGRPRMAVDALLHRLINAVVNLCGLCDKY
jgi:hypothetical protein